MSNYKINGGKIHKNRESEDDYCYWETPTSGMSYCGIELLWWEKTNKRVTCKRCLKAMKKEVDKK